MATLVDGLELEPLVIRTRPYVEVTDEAFFEFCQANRDWRIERAANGDILIMAPTGGGSSYRNADLTSQLRAWAKRDGRGVVFDSSAGFQLPNRATLSPDASWVRRERLSSLRREEKEKFLPLCPDFVAEILSPSDRLPALQKKMQEYIDNGAQLGWLLDPQGRRVHVYRPGAVVEQLEGAESVPGDPALPGFVLDLREIWEPGF